MYFATDFSLNAIGAQAITTVLRIA